MAWALPIAAAFAYFIVRGPIEAYEHKGFFDLRIHYAAAQAFWSGKNPYDLTDIAQVWLAGGNNPAEIPEAYPSIYPPTSFLLFTPIALFPWHIAKTVWLSLHLSALALLFWIWSKNLLVSANSWTRRGLLALILSYAPLQICVALGQPALSVFILAGFAIIAAYRQRETVAAILLAAAVCEKPNLLLGVLLFWFLSGRQRIVWRTVAIVAGLACLAVLQFSVHNIPWLHDLTGNLAQLTAKGALNDPSLHNSQSMHILSLQVIAHRFFESGAACTFAAFSCAAILTILAGPFLLRRQSDLTGELLCYAVIFAISSLPVYHRYYDGVLFLPTLVWAFYGTNAHASTTIRMLVAGCALAFLIPPGIVPFAVYHLHLGSSVTNSRWWQLLIIYPAWATLALSVALVFATDPWTEWRKIKKSPAQLCAS
ncbi:MAG: glycosyltransferase family 87 protein [Rhodomicrobium sp.]